MKDADLTHGGFYAHSPSRDAMLAEAADRAGAKTVAVSAGIAANAPAEEALTSLVHANLSKEHVENAAMGSGGGPRFRNAPPGVQSATFIHATHRGDDRSPYCLQNRVVSNALILKDFYLGLQGKALQGQATCNRKNARRSKGPHQIEPGGVLAAGHDSGYSTGSAGHAPAAPNRQLLSAAVKSPGGNGRFATSFASARVRPSVCNTIAAARSGSRPSSPPGFLASPAAVSAA